MYSFHVLLLMLKHTLVYGSCNLTQGAGRRLHGVIDVNRSGYRMAWVSDYPGHSNGV